MYRLALRLRRQWGLALGSVEWASGNDADVVAFRNGDVLVIANPGPNSIPLPAHAEILLLSDAQQGSELSADTTVWLRV